MLIYVEQITERLTYTFDFVFKDRGINYELTNDWKRFSHTPEHGFVYAEYCDDDEAVRLEPATLLFEDKIQNQQLEKGLFFGQECLKFKGIIDPFASIFYVLTRYEEYLPAKKDLHDRFPAQESVCYKYKWLDQVICDRWAEYLIQHLEEHLKTKLKKKKLAFRVVPSFDIDNTFAFKWKPATRRLLSYSRDYFKKDQPRIQARKAFLSGQLPDPYDSFTDIQSFCDRHKEVLLFWLLGSYSTYDKNISINDLRHQQLIQELDTYVHLGLHPSYKSNSNSELLHDEAKKLRDLVQHPVTSSRQHFLKISFPKTFQNLISAGFTDDYSLGFPEETGFRSGTARCFNFFDLSQNITTDLKIHPFCYMDGTLLEYKKYSPEQAMKQIQHLYDEVKEYGGDFIFVWHNETITDFGKWKGWRKVLDFTLQLDTHEI